MSWLFEIKNLSFEYHLGDATFQALARVDLKIPQASFLCLSGPSGSGKTTLLNILGLIEPVQSGEVFMNGNALSKIDEAEKNRIRRFELGFVFQNFNLIQVLRADENVEYFLERQGIEPNARKIKVENALRSVGLWEHRHKRPMQMSGGQRQRVALARAIAKEPKVIIADEPTASLDQKTGREIMDIFKELNRDRGVTILVSSHDSMVHSMVSQRIELKDGHIISGIQAGGELC